MTVLDRALAAPRLAAARTARLGAGQLEGLALLAVTACSWGMNWPIIKFLMSELPPFTVRGLVALAGCAFAFALARVRGERLSPPPGHFLYLLLFATLNYGGFVVFTTLALVWLKASEAVVITYTLPIWAALLAWPILGERPTLGKAAAMLLALAGVALLVGADGVRASWTTLPGVASAFLAAILFGLGTVLAKRRPLAMPPVAGVAWQALLGGLPVLLLAASEHPDFSHVPAVGWAGLAYSAVLPMTVGYLTWFRALRLLPAATAATSVLLAPAVGVVGSAVMLGDPLGPRQVLALAMTLIGVGLAARSR